MVFVFLIAMGVFSSVSVVLVIVAVVVVCVELWRCRLIGGGVGGVGGCALVAGFTW